MTDNAFAAVDLGATSGRVVRGVVEPDRIEVREVHRFANTPVQLPDGLHWNIGGLFAELCTGLAAAGPVRSAGIDSWAVDYGLLDADGALLGLPYHYRDRRTALLAPPAIGASELFRRNGIADLPFNTIHQLRAEPEHRLAAARRLLLIPDLLGYWLTGRMGTERTNASTTGLYHVSERDWDRTLISRLDLPHHLFAPISSAGTAIGRLREPIRSVAGGHDLTVVRVASHDTASAVAAVPATGPGFAYISCGTWSLVGVERPTPLLSAAARDTGFTNESGVCGIRYLRNVMGLWLLEECLREWPGLDIATLVTRAAELPGLTSVIDVDDPDFATPAGAGEASMTARIAARCDGPAPASPAEFARCIFDSLALGHARAVTDAVRTSGRRVEIIHLVGGGARNELLCRLTAEACGLPVAAGPVEATALGNLLAQAMAANIIGDWSQARALVAATHPPRRYEPTGDSAWRRAADRVTALAEKRAA
ncbi:rhamnulokinase [Nocardia cerradoensis]|uniref:Rhamnulokinase n=1 Tax=Nocardia cerradoensis TaxID=85688 RepID=A0A231GU13_9NOCA|nr:rhamnulokinase family protein [Nocardia cerradoensis]NKY43726.1 rhamnulokinase [Nocardia cerradoensis]OXR40110.1 Rhamnulokinase [Nocardia cerradoensis]